MLVYNIYSFPAKSSQLSLFKCECVSAGLWLKGIDKPVTTVYAHSGSQTLSRTRFTQTS